MTERPAVPQPRRSALFMPGCNARALEKARTLAVDVVILDLEDAVAPARKVTAREQVRTALDGDGYGSRQCVVRVNGLDTAWCRDDIAAMAGARPHALLFPKVECEADVDRLVETMDDAGVAAGVAAWVMVETPRGVLEVDRIVMRSPRVTCLVMGTSDLSRGMRVPHTPGRLGFLYALSRCVTAARAAGIDVLDGVHLDLGDERGLRVACEQGRNLGFDGKTLIHPRQVEAANRAFSPSEVEIANAHAVIQAWRRAAAEGLGVVVVNDRLVEKLHVEEAQRTLEIAAVIARRETG